MRFCIAAANMLEVFLQKEFMLTCCTTCCATSYVVIYVILSQSIVTTGNSRNQSPLAGNKKAARGNAFPHARAGTVGNSKDNRGQNSAMKNKKKGEIPGANLTQVSDLKQFFKEHNIPINHLLEKSDYFAMKMQFDELYKEFGSTGIAAKKLRESLIEMQARGGAGANNAGGTAQMNPNVPAGVPSASSAAFRSNSFEPENARQERLAALRSASSIGSTFGGTNKGAAFMSTSKPVFQPNIRAGSGGPGSSSSSSSSSNVVSTGPVSAKELDIVETAKKIVQTREYGKWAYDVLQLSWRTAEMKDIQKQYKIFMMVQNLFLRVMLIEVQVLISLSTSTSTPSTVLG